MHYGLGFCLDVFFLLAQALISQVLFPNVICCMHFVLLPNVDPFFVSQIIKFTQM